MRNKVNYRLLNILLLTAIIYLMYLLKDLVSGVLEVVINILKPFIIGFALAYAVYPFMKWLMKKKVPKTLSIFIIIVLILLFLTFVIISIIPIITTQLGTLFSSIITFISNIDHLFNIDLTSFKTSISGYFNTITNDLGKYISDGAISFVNASINFVSNFIIVLVAFIYFLFDMDNIRENIKLIFKKKSKKTFNLIKEIDIEITHYFKGLFLCIVIQFIEYTSLFYLIGHPNFLLLGLLASVSTVIPYFGGIIANIIAVISASVVSPELLIFTLIIAFICPNIDGYIISPKVYGKTNQISPLLSIFAVFTGGVLGGFVGILIALPTALIMLVIYRNYKKDIIKKIDNIKEKI